MKFWLVVVAAVVSLWAVPQESPLQPREVQQLLGRGFDVSWVEFNKNIEAYSDLQVKAMADLGFSTARIRTKLPADSILFSLLDPVIQDCFDNGIIPMIAYNAAEYEAVPTAENRTLDSLWWNAVAVHYQDYPYRLLFDLNIEWSDVGGKDVDGVNQWYESVTPAIRETNPHRIIFYSPIKLSNPEYLTEMIIPESAGEYVMAEFHSYAAGPNPDSLSDNGKPNPKYWTTGTEYQKSLVQDMISAGRNWQDSTGIYTWLGAWMAGNTNHGNTFTVQEQAHFADYFVHVLDSLEIPWAINTFDMYYDIESNQWIDSMLIVRDALTSVQTVSLSGDHGSSSTLSISSRNGTVKLDALTGVSRISVVTLAGRVISTVDIHGASSAAIPLTGFASGTYILRIFGVSPVSIKLVL